MAATTKTVRPHTTCSMLPSQVARRPHSLQAPPFHTYSLQRKKNGRYCRIFGHRVSRFGQEGPCQHANRVTFRPKPVETVRFPLQTRVSANPHLINLIHDACFCGSIGHFFCFAQSSWRDCGTVVGSVPWIPFFVSGRPGNTGMRHALPTTPSYGPTLSHDASR